MAASKQEIQNIENSIQAANFNLYHLKRVYGEDSQIYSYYRKEVEKTFKAYDMENVIQYSEKTGAIKIDKKRAALSIAAYRTNEKNILTKFIRSIPTTKSVREKTAKEFNVPYSDVTKEQQESYFQAETDFKNSLSVLYGLIEGSSYREVLLPQLYSAGGNKGDLTNKERQEIINLIDFYNEKGTAFLNTATAEELEALRKEAKQHVKA